MGAKRRRVIIWAALAGVVLGALVAGWFVFDRVTAPVPAEPVQTSVSPDGHWELRTWFVGEERLGHPEGVLRVDVADLTAPRGSARTIYADPVPDRDATRRVLLWRDADRVYVSLANGGYVVLDAARAPDQNTPGEFATMMKAVALATVCLLAVLAAGVFAVLLTASWLDRREAERWEAWPVDWREGRRHATQG